ncbi:MAG: glycosyltransferase family 4 protein [Pirellulales bacterium]|nr:glycosyltransferase family 4 protein [Pirellulales bacterium]
MIKLGMPRGQIATGYDVVDNYHFATGSIEANSRSAELRLQYMLPSKYFLGSNRFIPKKNLSTLLTAFSAYRRRVGAAAWDLVIIGDGELRPELERQRDDLGIQTSVHLPGFKQYDELPIFYGLAKAFIHASTVEQWGLVVNEAMASGLPVLVSKRCGCVPDLVSEGVNGWTFDPYSADAIADAMVRMTELDEDRRRTMGKASQRIIADWGPERFAAGLKAAAEKALEVGPKRAALLDRAMLELLMRTAR